MSRPDYKRRCLELECELEELREKARESDRRLLLVMDEHYWSNRTNRTGGTHVSAIIDPATVVIPAGTVVHICGWPVEVATDVEVTASRGNIELVTRDLYLRKQTPLATAHTGSGESGAVGS
jgi:hypothetical protein